jgi:hypothetical protein
MLAVRRGRREEGGLVCRGGSDLFFFDGFR